MTGDVYFGRNVTLRGTVISRFSSLPFLYALSGYLLVVANEGQRIDIPDGCILENRTLGTNLGEIYFTLAHIVFFRFAFWKPKSDCLFNFHFKVLLSTDDFAHQEL